MNKPASNAVLPPSPTESAESVTILTPTREQETLELDGPGRKSFVLYYC